MLHRDGVRIKFSELVKDIFYPIPGTYVRGSTMTIKRVWDWQNFLRVASHYFLVRPTGCEYDFDTCDAITVTHGFKTMRANKNRVSTATARPKADKKTEGLKEIPLSVNLSSKQYLKNTP